MVGLAIMALAGLWPIPAGAEESRIFTRAELIQDARQLTRTIELSHPDPYTNCGGKIAFHRRFQRLIRAIPAEGATWEAFHRLLLPFVAVLGDGHTGVVEPAAQGPDRPGLRLDLRIVGESLHVASAYERDGRDLLGARLASIEGIPFPTLVERQRNLRGAENEYLTLALLQRGLRTERSLRNLLPEWVDRARIRVELCLQNGETREFVFDPGDAAAEAAKRPASKIRLPDLKGTSMGWCYLDSDRRTALLKIADLESYREACESWLASGMSEAPQMVRAAYRRLHGKDGPDSLAAVVAGIPPATDVFRDLVVSMKRSDTKNLIVDLRDNTGGNSLAADILIYFLFGEQAMLTRDRGYSIIKYSPLYFQMYTAASLDTINAGMDVALDTLDYDFSYEEARQRSGLSTEERTRWIEGLRRMPSFYRVFEQGRYGAYNRPERIVVLCSAMTFSSGFNLLTALQSFGAIVVGTPPAQAGNNFGDSLILRLANTGLTAYVSFKQIVAFPDDPVKGRCLMPDRIMTPAAWESLGFDPNAEVLMALDLLQEDHPGR